MLASAGAAKAADLPAILPPDQSPPAAVVPSYDCTGFYVGAQIGDGWGDASGTQNAGGTFFPVGPYTIDPAGALAGGHVGFNYQAGALVLGAEADLEASNLNGSSVISAFNQTYSSTPKPIRSRRSAAERAPSTPTSTRPTTIN